MSVIGGKIPPSLAAIILLPLISKKASKYGPYKGEN
jgi:hypothetical protein